MGVIDKIKNDAAGKRIQIQTPEAEELQKYFNKLLYLPHNIEQETRFIKMVMTRGAETQERVGLHASAMLTGEKQFCMRQQVLSLVYKQSQGERLPVGLLRIFEEGNAIHEKWQRLLLRGGYATWKELDYTQMCDKYMMSFTPDIICHIPDFYDGPMIGEIKSVNTFQFKKMSKHPSAWKQCQWYMHLTGIKKGFVLSEDKNTQETKFEVYKYSPELVAPFIARAEEIMYRYHRLIDEHKMVSKPEDAKSPSCKRCKECAMRDACWNIGNGRVRLGE